MRRAAYLMILDGEEDETLRVFLKKWFVHLITLDARGNSRLGRGLCRLNSSFRNHITRNKNILNVLGVVLFLFAAAEVGFLDGRLDLKGLNGRGGLKGGV